ncbi:MULTISPECIES: hypothetical protein [Bacillus]|uniref:hypothetical protein n=1 Tax=Bacillus TaxID=1386 RepID=UPI00099374E4|nr:MULTISPECIES: hypothetical protein [Bacillus cereus group]MDP1458279.1 hypothetical protein [Bacillus wiedmannii]OOR64413.1 hypothetical protein BLX04_07575 [Bacillus mycoides]PEJ69027.1 hypothetical protein CN685_16835 [Bacillus wiedmannii]UOB97370.1 hypothetical protein BTI679_47270 [Bacillus wiedmannii]
MNGIKQKNLFTNNTDFYILLGDYTDIVSYHETWNDATITLRSIHISDSSWTSIWILKPGETLSGTYINAPHEEHGDVSYRS